MDQNIILQNPALPPTQTKSSQVSTMLRIKPKSYDAMMEDLNIKFMYKKSFTFWSYSLTC